MAKKVVLIDDVSGETIDPDLGGGTVRFSIEGKDYSIDLGVKNKEEFFKDFDKWTKHATEESRSTGATRQRRASSASGRSKEELANIREWAQKNGYEVSARGRIAKDIQDAYDEAHKG
ncbi:histone-like nucleoid-structuring protein Lsr2 [Rhodococcus rhodochrous]|uniref:histone-like nucleoid-structuring protein Lsr2 n=1 Tax=Rhodococcus rhodochrous TaxID=1829 RepID=UPI001780A68D|nr:Lsr2 family protein [Rhodococcus rhodochrous]QOH56261.1 hypothetical protein C6Y44_10000 [Rhodococcus rhodochrous]